MANNYINKIKKSSSENSSEISETDYRALAIESYNKMKREKDIQN